MGLGGVSIWQLLIILVIIVLLFGTKRLRNIGNDLGSAIRGFRNSIKDSDENTEQDATFPAETKRDPAVTAQPAATPAANAQPSQPAAPASLFKINTDELLGTGCCRRGGITGIRARKAAGRHPHRDGDYPLNP